jgi:hypothetical protein
MSFADVWFHDDENVAGSQTKEENQKVINRSHLRDYIGQYSSPLVRPSGYEVRKLLQKKMLKKEAEIEAKKTNKPSLRERISLCSQ